MTLSIYDYKKNKFELGHELDNIEGSKIAPLDHDYGGYTYEDKHQALIQFTQQASAHFPEILDSDRDKAAAQIHIKNIEEQINRSNQDSQVVVNALNALTKIAEKKQDDMLACALLDYIDELVEMISPRQ